MPGKIYWKYDYYRGGLGDFVNGALSTFVFCRDRGIEFAIWIPNHPLSSCFDLPACNNVQTTSELFLDANQYHGVSAPKERKLLDYIFDTNPSTELCLVSNIWTIVSEAEMKAAASAFIEILRPSSPVKARMSEIINLPPKSYVSLHIRCGDAFMRPFDRYCPGDNRCNSSDALDAVHSAINIIGNDLPIILHTDNEALRTVAPKQVIVLNTRIQHTAQHSESGDPVDYYDTVAEFYLMSASAHIYYIVPSGFSKCAAIIGNTPITHLQLLANK